MKRIFVLITTLILFGSYGWAVESGKVEGALVVRGETYQLKYAYPQTSQPSWDFMKIQHCVKLSDVVLTEKELDNDYVFLKEGKAHVASICVDHEGRRDGEIIIGHQALPDLRAYSEEGKVEVLNMGKSQLAARISIRGEKGGIPFECKASFEVKIDNVEPIGVVKERVFKNGTPLPAGGGLPAKNYLKFNNTFLSGDFEGTRKLAVTSYSESMKLESYKQILNVLRHTHVRNIQIVEGAVSGNEAVMEVKGVIPVNNGTETSPAWGIVVMELEGSEWKYKGERWH